MLVNFHTAFNIALAIVFLPLTVETAGGGEQPVFDQLAEREALQQGHDVGEAFLRGWRLRPAQVGHDAAGDDQPAMTDHAVTLVEDAAMLELGGAAEVLGGGDLLEDREQFLVTMAAFAD